MFRLNTALTQADALASLLFSNEKVSTTHTSRVREATPVTESCIPNRRRRARRHVAAASGEPLRSTWF